MDRRQFITGGALLAAATMSAPGEAFATAGAVAGIFAVTDYGAIGDGVTDDTAAIQSAIAAAHDAGGVVWFPAGVYITSTLTLHGGVTLEGTGWASVVRLKGGTNAPVITTPVGQLNYYGAVANLTIDGNRASNASSSAHGIRLWGADHYRVHGVRVINCGGAAIKGDGDSSHYTIAPYISESYLNSCTGSGLDVNSYTYDVKAHAVDIGLCDKGVVLSNSSFFHDVSVWQCNTGIYGYWTARAHLLNCRVERSQYHGFWLEGCSDMVLEGCRAYENNQSNGSYNGFHATGSSGHVTQRVSIVGCHSGLLGSIYEKQRYGFSANASYADYLLCSNCVAVGNVTAGYNLATGGNNVISSNL